MGFFPNFMEHMSWVAAIRLCQVKTIYMNGGNSRTAWPLPWGCSFFAVLVIWGLLGISIPTTLLRLSQVIPSLNPEVERDSAVQNTLGISLLLIFELCCCDVLPVSLSTLLKISPLFPSVQHHETFTSWFCFFVCMCDFLFFCVFCFFFFFFQIHPLPLV